MEEFDLARFIPVCKTSDVPQGEARMFLIAETRIGIYHLGDDFFALDDQCPHAGASLAQGLIRDGVVACRIHHWHFCVRSGRYLDEENPRYDLRTFPLRVVEGQILVGIKEVSKS